MNIYFTASARASNDQKNHHPFIYKTIVELGHIHIDDYKINSDHEKFYSSKDFLKANVYKSALNFVKQADLVILEVSTHSLTMGYLIKHAIDVHTPIIALHIKEHSPGFILGIENDAFQLIEYNKENLKNKLKNAISYVENLEDVRFNLMLSPKVNIYLTEAAKEVNLSKAKFIRNLIKEHQKNRE